MPRRTSAAEEAFDRVEDFDIKAMRFQYALDRPKDTGVVVEDNDPLATGHNGKSRARRDWLPQPRTNS